MKAEKAGRWFRVSDKKQNEQNQVPEVDAWCDNHHYITSDETTYTIHGITAFKGSARFDREWAKVLDDFRTGKINVLVVWKQDRIDRKLQTFQMLAQVVELGGRVEFVTQPHLNDLTTMAGRIALKVQEEIAYGESKDKSDRIRIKQAALKKDNSVTGKPCYGFRVACIGHAETHNTTRCGHVKTFVPEPMEAEGIRQAIKHYLSGDSLLTVCRWLDSEGIGPRHAANWTPKSLAVIFRNPSLIGRNETKRGRGKLILTHEPILTDRDVWDAVQAEMDKRGRDSAIIRRSDTAKLTNIAFCSCGEAMYQHGSKSRYGTINLYYRCHGKNTDPSKCKNLIRLDWLDGFVESALRHPSRGLGMLRIIETTVKAGRNHQKEIDEIDDEIRDLDPNAPDWWDQVTGLRARRDVLVNATDTEPTVTTKESDETILERWITLSIAEKRAFLMKLGVTITVRPAQFRGEDPASRITMNSTEPRIAEALARLMAA